MRYHKRVSTLGPTISHTGLIKNHKRSVKKVTGLPSIHSMWQHWHDNTQLRMLLYMSTIFIPSFAAFGTCIRMLHVRFPIFTKMELGPKIERVMIKFLVRAGKTNAKIKTLLSSMYGASMLGCSQLFRVDRRVLRGNGVSLRQCLWRMTEDSTCAICCRTNRHTKLTKTTGKRCEMSLAVSE